MLSFPNFKIKTASIFSKIITELAKHMFTYELVSTCKPSGFQRSPSHTLYYEWMINTLGQKANKQNLESCSPLDTFLPTPSMNFKPLNVCSKLQYLVNLFYCWYDLYPVSTFPLRQWAHMIVIYLCCVYIALNFTDYK